MTGAAQNPDGSNCGAGATGFQIMSGQTACATDQLWSFFQGAALEELLFFATDLPFQTNPGSLGSDASISLTVDLPETLERFNGGRFTISQRATDVPEPATLSLVAISLPGLGVATRRR